MERYLKPYVLADADKKIILISGPRQSGKTTLSRGLFLDYDYFNYDYAEDQLRLSKRHWRRAAECVIFDEIHKMAEWKRWLKGIYDVEGLTPKIIVTGSANLEVFTNVGDSLAGRYFRYRLHPLDIKEIFTLQGGEPHDILQNLMQFSGFPEPFLQQSIDFYKKWQQTHLEVILRQDFLDLYAVRSIVKIELLVELLKTRITAPLSYTNLATDLQVSPKSVQAWMTLLENFFVLFKVTPYHKNIARSVLKEPKYYFFDIGRGQEEGARLENLVACALLKEINFLQDTKGLNLGLYYLRNKDGVEVDFLITLANKPLIAIEVKTTDDTPSKAFAHFKKFLLLPHCVQLVANLARDFDTPDGIQVRHLATFLARLDLSQYSLS